MKRLYITLLIPLLLFTACQAGNPFSPATATPQNCAWSQASGPGSAPFEKRVQTEFVTAKIDGTVQSSTYGENNSCDNSFHAMSLDSKVEINVISTDDTPALAATAGQVSAILLKSLPASNVPNMGNITLTFKSKLQNKVCTWDFSKSECQQ